MMESRKVMVDKTHMNGSAKALIVVLTAEVVE